MGHLAILFQSNVSYISYVYREYHYETPIYDLHTPTTILNLPLFPTIKIPHQVRTPFHPIMITPSTIHPLSTKSIDPYAYVSKHVKYYTYKNLRAKQPYSKVPNIQGFPCVLPLILDVTITQNPIRYILVDSYNTSNIQSFLILLVLRLYQKTTSLLQAKERYTWNNANNTKKIDIDNNCSFVIGFYYIRAINPSYISTIIFYNISVIIESVIFYLGYFSMISLILSYLSPRIGLISFILIFDLRKVSIS